MDQNYFDKNSSVNDMRTLLSESIKDKKVLSDLQLMIDKIEKRLTSSKDISKQLGEMTSVLKTTKGNNEELTTALNKFNVNVDPKKKGFMQNISHIFSDKANESRTGLKSTMWKEFSDVISGKGSSTGIFKKLKETSLGDISSVARGDTGAGTFKRILATSVSTIFGKNIKEQDKSNFKIDESIETMSGKLSEGLEGNEDVLNQIYSETKSQTKLLEEMTSYKTSTGNIMKKEDSDKETKKDDSSLLDLISGGGKKGIFKKLFSKGMLGKAGKFLGKAGPIAALIGGGIGAFKGFNEESAKELYGQGGTGTKIASGAVHMLSGMTGGLISPKLIKDITSGIGDGIFKYLVEPIIAKIKWVADKVKKVFTTIVEFFTSPIKTIKGLMDKFSTGIDNMWKWLEDLPIIGKFFKTLRSVGSAVIEEGSKFVQAPVQYVKEKAVQTYEKTKDVGKWLGEKLGIVSSKYETGGKGASAVSTGEGDFGGASYGSYQLSSKAGTLDKFLSSSKYAGEFKGLEPGSQEFNAKWKEIAARDKGFGEAQHGFIQKTHYAPQASKILNETGLDISKRSKALQESVFSTSVQYGAGSKTIVNALKGVDTSKLSDEELIKIIQNYKLANVEKDFKSSSSKVQEGVKNRIVSEGGDLLALNKAEVNPKNKIMTEAEIQEYKRKRVEDTAAKMNILPVSKEENKELLASNLPTQSNTPQVIQQPLNIDKGDKRERPLTDKRMSIDDINIQLANSLVFS